ncbi:hypothetical protein [Pseudoxanthomonas japonensis]|uniref:hypothetical protein n=1 Tax=Pseudoxanthomonas japonensis TaxID=69284 RepID=UPI00374857B1
MTKKTLCHELIEEATGRAFTAAEVDRFKRRFERRAARLRESEMGLSYNDSLARVVDEFKQEAEMMLAVSRREVLLDQLRRMDALDQLEGQWKDDPSGGLKAMLVGTQDARAGARRSIGTEMTAMTDQMLGGMVADVAAVEPAALKIFSSGAQDDDVARALWALSNGDKLDGFPSLTVGIAKAVRKWQEYSRVTANDAGAWIGETRGYIVSTYHDTSRIARDRDGWMEYARTHFDLQRMADEMEVDMSDMQNILSGIWQDFADGVHMKLWQPPKPKGPWSNRDAGKDVSWERVIHFKSADSWTAYNEAFGAGNLREAAIWGLRSRARAVALLNGLGPHYEANYDRLGTEVLAKLKRSKAPPETITKFQRDVRRYKRMYLAELDGSLDVPGNDTLATVSGTIRAIQSMSSLGGSTLSSVSDLGVIVLGAKYNGLNALQTVSRGIGNLFKSVPSAERLELQADLGLALNSLTGKLAHGRFTPEDDVRGMIGSLQQKFFTWNLQNRWTDAFRESIAEMMSANLARRVGEGFDLLPERLQTTLGLYGIDAGRWDLIRQAELGEVEGSKFLSPSALDDLPDHALQGYLEAHERPTTAGAIKDLRRELQRQLRSYFVDQRDYMLLSPDAGTMGMLKQGTQRGTGLGEAVRFMMQFKSFPLAYTHKIIGREIAQGGMAGVAQMIALTIITGYAAMALKDAFKLRKQRDPTDWRTLVAAFNQGGGAGLYSDVLFSQVLDRRFKDAAISLLGPTASDANSLSDIMARIAQGEDAGAATVRFVQGNTPMLNIFYAKVTLDYLIFYRIQEWMNPGSLRRMEERIREQTGQEFIAPPSEVIN